MGKLKSALAGAGTGAEMGGPWGAAIGGILGLLSGSNAQSQQASQNTMDAFGTGPQLELDDNMRRNIANSIDNVGGY